MLALTPGRLIYIGCNLRCHKDVELSPRCSTTKKSGRTCTTTATTAQVRPHPHPPLLLPLSPPPRIQPRCPYRWIWSTAVSRQQTRPPASHGRVEHRMARCNRDGPRPQDRGAAQPYAQCRGLCRSRYEFLLLLLHFCLPAGAWWSTIPVPRLLQGKTGA